MSDEIDIEEHDVMDNPSIKRIFPDLSVIKKEINQYYDEVLNATPETTLEELSQEGEINTDSTAEPLVHKSNELVSSSPFNVPEFTETSTELRYLHENIIILGTKPNLECGKNNYYKDIIKLEPKLILKNISSFLNTSKRYCKQCCTLFPKAKLLKLHKDVAHTEIKNNGYTTSSQLKEMGRKVTDKLYKCNICDRIVSCRSHLIRHFRNLHNNVKTNTSNKKFVPSEVTKIEAGLACFHCQELFPTQSSLIEHLYKVLEPRKIETSSCSTSTISAKKIKKMENPNDKLTDDESVKSLDESKNIECSECTLEFRSRKKFDEHHRDHHQNAETPLKTRNFNSENILPRNNGAIRGNSKSVVGLRKCDDNKVKNNKHIAKSKSMTLKTKKCEKCGEQFNSKWELEYHIMSVHRKYKRSIIKKLVKSKIKKQSIEHFKSLETSKKPLRSMFYKCFICSKYNVTFKFYSRHIVIDHNIKEVTEVKKERFDSQCKFCSSKLSDAKSYNAHLYKYHQMLLKKPFIPREEHGAINQEGFKKEIQFALKNVLYTCMKCDLFFLSSDAALDHSKHLKILNNWKCTVCKRVLNKEDMALHVKQHSFSQSFTVLSPNEATFSRVLYKCSNCTVHYSEKNFLLHYKKCDSETPNSLYCKDCDCLMNRDDMNVHELNHKDKKMQGSEFTIIEADMIDDKCISPNNAKIKKTILKRNENASRKKQESPKIEMSFCRTCKCFICHINHTRRVHIEGRCGHMLKTVCKECGLVLTMKTHATHKEHHKKLQFNLNNYTFFDLKSKKKICPPIPEYPSCKMCGVHFLRNFAITIHSCEDQDYVTCNICSIKLTEHAYELHMAFHNYSIQNIKKGLKDTELELRPTNDVSNEDSCVSDNSNFEDVFFYTCKSCEITVDTYDKVVQHCQNHYDCKNVQLDKQKCQYCIYEFDRSDYDSHNKLHKNEKYNNDSIPVVHFDPFYFPLNNASWIKHVFADVAEETIKKILDTSIYKYECRVKMEEVQRGSPSLILYKCDKCQVFIEPHSLYLHAENSKDSSCVNLRKHPCGFCGLCFVSSSYRIAHEKYHEGGLNLKQKSYKIILFNKMEHEKFNKIMYDAQNRYILYQCRNCECVVDKLQRRVHKCDENNLKICLICGLLFHQQDYNLHHRRHKELDKFNTENIIVVMFRKMCYLGKKDFRSTFNGTKYDYAMYKCKTCDLCFRTNICTSEHVCVFDNSKCKCSKCGFYFVKLELNHHSKLHESNLEFDELDISIITFDKSSTKLDGDHKITLHENNDSQKQTEEAKGKNCVVKESANDCSEKFEKIYKCDCGLHFLEELNAQRHANNCNVKMKISKQSCFKCDLLFTPGELFNHLLKHHCDKKLQYKFDTVIVSKEKNRHR